eukprot:m.134889 g.134889  ORF g.134889 m.134889 type:complete len:465 (+) comp14705_c0_seq2:71-1465(+)
MKLPTQHLQNIVCSLLACLFVTSGYDVQHLTGSYPNFAIRTANIYLMNGNNSTCDVTSPPWHAKGDGKTLDTAAIQGALNACKVVTLPKGFVFLSGALNLTSHVTFVIHGTLLASTSPSHYPVVPALPGYGTCRDNGFPPEHAFERHQAFISGWNLSDVVVMGDGKIDGQGLVKDPVLGTSWVDRFRNKTLDYGRPRIYEPMFSYNLTLQGLTIQNQAFWCVHPYASSRILISSINISAPRDEGINNDDGIDPDSCFDVLVDNCIVSVGDNSVAIKSGMDASGRQFAHASYNQVFRNSVFESETFAIGSEMSGGVYNITVEGCTFGTGGSDYAGIHLKSKRGRGGAIHDLVFTNNIYHMETSTKQGEPMSASLYYSSNPPPTNATATPHMYNVRFEDSLIYLPPAVESAKSSFQFIGLPESQLKNFSFQNITVVNGVSNGWVCTDTQDFTFSDVIPAPSKLSGC